MNMLESNTNVMSKINTKI